MAFLDNSGDIILDAVLTDTGRKRLARGDGSFRISKFCLHDDEIDYGLYNKNHPSGSAYYDLEILQTPILEAFTNNTSGMKHKLISISRTNLLYLPEMVLQAKDTTLKPFGVNVNSEAETNNSLGLHVIAVDQDSLNSLFDAALSNTTVQGSTFNGDGILNGLDPSDGNNALEIHQGLNSSAKSDKIKIDPSLEETQFIIEMDNRLGTLCDINSAATNISPTFIDDDNIASYFITNGSVSTGFTSLNVDDVNGTYPQGTPAGKYTSLLGSRGSAIAFKIRASTELQGSTYLFTTIGSTTTMTSYTDTSGGAKTYHIIDSIIRVTGGTTGYSLEIPVRYVKYKTP